VDFLIGPFKTLIGHVLSFFVAGGWIARLGKAIPAAFTLIKSALTVLGSKFGGILKVFLTPFRGLLNFLKGLPGPIGRAITFIVNKIVSVWRTVRGFIVNIARGTWDRVVAIFNKVKGWLVPIIKSVTQVLASTWGVIGDIVNKVIGWFRKLQRKISDILGGVADIISDAFDAAVGVLKGAINIMIGLINWFIRQWNSVFGEERKISVPFGPDVTIPALHIGEITPLAKGGILTGTVFAAGERGREAVIPLSKNVMKRLAQQIMGALTPSVPPTALGAGKFPLPAGAIAGGQTAGINIERIELPPPPEGGVPDARYQAAQLAAELRRRGGR
jgi:hypothetical protein